jgi:hypothetical protein
MDIETSSAIKLFFPSPSLLLVYYEAIANALDAGATEIEIEISIASFSASETLALRISDNGSGFTDESFERFKTLMKPKDNFHKGIGRLVYLSYFDRVGVKSEWDTKSRAFTFRGNFDGQSKLTDVQVHIAENKTQLSFNGFAKDKVKSYDDLKPDSLKSKIVFHFLPTLNALREKNTAFKISIRLETQESNAQREFFSTDVTITNDDLPRLERKEIRDDRLDTISDIVMHYYVRETTSAAELQTAVSIDGRTIPLSLIQKSSIPFGYSVAFIFSSELFSASADTSRQNIVLPAGVSESTLYSVLRREIGAVLSEKIPRIAETNEKTKKKFEDQFPHLLGFFEDATVGLIDEDDALNVAEQKSFRLQKEILRCENLNDDLYEKSLEAASRTLTEYILYREKIIQRIGAMTPANSEREIHNIIVPQRVDFHQTDVARDAHQNNAWLLDDKFMTFRTILSDARMDRVIQAIRLQDDVIGESGRPDIAMIFSADPDDAVPVDVVVVEIKKKTDDEKENQYSINQLLDRAQKLALHCHNVQRIWYYALLQINESFENRLLQQKWTPLFSKGRVFYQEFPTRRGSGQIVPTPIIVMSFDALVSDAAARNHTFLEILRAAMKRHSETVAPTNNSPDHVSMMEASVEAR